MTEHRDDLRRFTEPAIEDADLHRQMREGKRRWQRRQRRRRLLAAVVFTMGGTAAASFAWLVWSERERAGARAPDHSAAERSARLVPAPARAPRPPQPPITGLSTVQASPADGFVDSVGLHLRLEHPLYVAAYPALKQRLQELGIRRVSDVSSTRLDRLRELGASLGLRAHILVHEGTDPRAVARSLGDVLASLEANWRFGRGLAWRRATYDAAWALRIRRFAESLHRQVRASPELRGVEVIGPSIRWPYETALVGDLGAWADLGAVNYWSAPNPPGNDSLDNEIAGQRAVFPNQPLVVTQGGYSTARVFRGGSPLVQAKYLIRMHLECFAHGIVRTFANQLLDLSVNPESFDSGLGITTRSAEPKPAFFALQRLLAELSDPGAPFAPGALSFALASDATDMRRLVLGKRDGSFVLALWLSRPSSDEDARASATLRLAEPVKSIVVTGPISGPDSRSTTQAAQEIMLEVTDGVTLVHIHP